MKSIANQYRDLKEGKMSQANFMRNLRMSMPQVTNVMSFGDAVKVLKNKGIITESHLEEEMAADKEKDNRYNSLVSTNRGEDKEWAKLSRDEREKIMYADTDSDLANFDPNEVGGLGRHQNLSKGIDDNSDAEFDAILKQLEDEMAGGEAVNAQYDLEEAKSPVSKDQKIQVIKEWIWYCFDEGTKEEPIQKWNAKIDNYFADKDDVTFLDFKNIWNEMTYEIGVGDVGADSEEFGETWNDVQKGILNNPGKIYETLNEAKETTNPNKVHPQEYTMGIRYELKCFKGDVVKAERAVLKNLAKEPFYYTALKLAGKDIYKEAPSVKAEAPKKKSKKKEVELVDTINAMQKVKMPKAEEKKKLKEQVDEKMRFQDLPADPEKYKMVKDSKGYIIKATNADGVEFQKGDTAKTYDGEEIKIVKFEESQGKVKAIYNKGMFFAGIDIDGLEAPKPTMRPGVDMGSSFEKMKAKLSEMVKKAMAEFYDGRDNLTNISDDTK